jgi:uncharacterized protein
MKIGLISDTHSYIDELTLSHLKGCDEIWHAGDIGNGSVIEQLNILAPVKAVYGNIDDGKMRQIYPENEFIEVGNLKILMTHIAGTPPSYNSRVKQLLREKKVDVIICGHSHILKVTRDPANNVLYINPGAAGIHGFHKMRTIMRFEILENKFQDMRVIELGKRGKL